MISDDPAPGSLTVFQSSRVARPQDASKALHLVSLLSASARSDLDAHKQRMLRPVPEVADKENLVGTGWSFRRSSLPAQLASPRGFRSRSGEGWFRRVC